MATTVRVAQYGEVIPGYDQIFDAGVVLVEIGDKEPVLLQMNPDHAYKVGKALIGASKVGKRLQRQEATESFLTSMENSNDQ